jgi:hypothetical protein
MKNYDRSRVIVGDPTDQPTNRSTTRRTARVFPTRGFSGHGARDKFVRRLLLKVFSGGSLSSKIPVPAAVGQL